MGLGGVGLRERVTNGHEEPCGDEVCVHCLDCSDDFTGVYGSKHQILLFKYMQFIIYISKGM